MVTIPLFNGIVLLCVQTYVRVTNVFIQIRTPQNSYTVRIIWLDYWYSNIGDWEHKSRKHTSCPFKNVPNASKNVKHTWGSVAVPERGVGAACRALRKTWFSEESYFSRLTVTSHFFIDVLHSSTPRQALEHWEVCFGL